MVSKRKVIAASQLQIDPGKILKRVTTDDELLVIDQNFAHVAVLMPFADYMRLIAKEKALTLERDHLGEEIDAMIDDELQNKKC